MSAEIIEQNGCLLVSGSLNFSTVVPLWQTSMHFFDRFSEMKFDLSNVKNTNSAGLALLLEWQRMAKRHRKVLSFYHIPEQLLSIASVAGVDLPVAKN